jgi:lipid II:glycine glycyltransferase (peptidoglycan interpeptide bridge formation enzyme)
VNLRAVLISDPLEWDTLVKTFAHHSALQGWGFGEARRVTDWTPHRLRLERDGVPFAAAQVLRRSQYGLGYLYCPRGPAINHLEDLDDVATVLKRWATLTDVSLKIEPPVPVSSSGDPSIMPAQLGVWTQAETIQPAHTVLIDLEQPEEARLSAMHQMAKRNTKQSIKEGVTADPDDDFEAFWALFEETNTRSKLLQRQKAYYQAMFTECAKYGGEARIINARWNGTALATCFVIGLGNELCYLYGGSIRAERSEGQRDPKAPNGAYWGMIRYGIQKGYKVLDLYGIPKRIDESTSEKISNGVYEFKMRLGGQMAYFPAYEIALNPLSSFVNTALRARRKALNKKARGTEDDVL